MRYWPLLPFAFAAHHATYFAGIVGGAGFVKAVRIFECAHSRSSPFSSPPHAPRRTLRLRRPRPRSPLPRQRPKPLPPKRRTPVRAVSSFRRAASPATARSVIKNSTNEHDGIAQEKASSTAMCDPVRRDRGFINCGRSRTMAVRQGRGGVAGDRCGMAAVSESRLRGLRALLFAASRRGSRLLESGRARSWPSTPAFFYCAEGGPVQSRPRSDARPRKASVRLMH